MQEKRFHAQTNHTTYAYDFPDMFRQITERMWTEYLNARQSSAAIVQPLNVIAECTELVWRNGRLEEVARPVGENDVGWNKSESPSI